MTRSKKKPASPPPSIPPAELDLRRFYAAMPARPGAFDYRMTPSLMGGQRVPYWHGAYDA
ncbi:MAG: hypothetical protein WBG17_05180 [Burkholderiaceae bacterium]